MSAGLSPRTHWPTPYSEGDLFIINVCLREGPVGEEPGGREGRDVNAARVERQAADEWVCFSV